MSHLGRFFGFVFSLVTLALGAPFPEASADAPSQAALGPETDTAVDYALSRPAGELPPSTDGPADVFRPSRINPLANEPDSGQRGTWDRPSVPTDPLSGPPAGPGVHTPVLDFDFEGVGNPQACGGCTPPDPNGDVGPDHYVQMVNATKVAIFDKTGMSLAPAFNLGSLWPGGTCAQNDGDPIVVYDSLADRWVLSQFADPSHMCFAISQTGDPLGSYHLFTFNVGSFPDYFKLGVWPDAYYMSANESTYTAYAFNRAKMLVGDPSANFVKFTGQTNFLLPADLDGPTPPPTGSPGYFYTFKDNAFHGGVDRIEVFTFEANFVDPRQSSAFTLTASLPIAPYTYTVCGFFNFNCAMQQGTNQRIDVVSEWPMHRFPYRNFGSHETLLGNFTVGGGSGDVGAAIRWFELRQTDSDWTLFQEGTHDPGDGDDRFMGSIAMDGANNIALGYSVSSSTLFPAIRYATRSPGVPVGTLQPEAVLINGGGSQTGSNRWGDYSAMSVDPVDDCTFWYTNSYYPVNAANAWKTRVGVFNLCGGPAAADLVLTKTDSPDPVGAGGNITYSIGASNVGGAAAMSVVLTDNTPANTTFQSLNAPGWTCSIPPVGGTGDVSCTMGTLGPGASAPLTLMIQVNPGTPGGTLITNNASISAADADPTPGNNNATATTTVAMAGGSTISIADAQVTEHRTNMVFTLTLSAASAQTVTVTAGTANNTATAPGDYQAKTATVTFLSGQTSRPFAVSVKEDTLVEGTETFFVNLSNAVNASIGDGQAVGTLLDDD